MQENLHTHTTRCRHASGTEEEYVQQAIAGGLQVLGFSDHTPHRFPGTYYSTMRMFPEELEDYCATVMALKEKYAGQIHIYLGLEVEYYPRLIPALLELIKPFPIEYMILGQHWCGNEENEIHNGRATDDELSLARYCDQTIEAMQTGLFTYFAHPDLFNFIGDDSIYRRHIGRLCQTAKDTNVPLEINFLGLRDGRNYPRELFWEIAGEIGCPVVFGSDAHTVQHVFDLDTEARASAMVKKYNLTLLEHIPIRPWYTAKIAK